MSTSKTGIEWTDRTWNPVSGCSKVSLGCKHCYAETVANRFWKGRPFTDVQCHADRLDQPLRWKKPARIFVNSMSDLFHEDVPDDFIDAVFGVMAACRGHTFQILTKRPERMKHFISTVRARAGNRFLMPALIGHAACHVTQRRAADKLNGEANRRAGEDTWPLPNVHLGVSVENQAAADERIPILLQTPASVRFLSVEPLLEAVDLTEALTEGIPTNAQLNGPDGLRVIRHGAPRIDWVIVGGESGSGARPCNIEWIRGIVAQCKAASVPVFVKQLGSNPDFHFAELDCRDASPIHDRKGGDINEWPEDLRIREFPA